MTDRKLSSCSESSPFLHPKVINGESVVSERKKTFLGCSKRKCIEVTKTYLPFLSWAPKYNLHWLQCDLIAGMTVGLTVIPQGLAYAQIAGLPVQYGLYSAFMGGFIYCIFGTSKDITLGPTAIMSLLVHAYGNDDPVQAILLTFLAGIIQLSMGLLRLGFIMRYISVPVISGFTSAAAITIAFGQLKHIFGVKTASNSFFPELVEFFKNIKQTNVWDVVMGLCCMVTLTLLRYLKEWIEPISANDTLCEKIAKKFIWILSTARNAVVVVSAGLVAYTIHTQHITSCKVEDCITLTGKIDEGLPPFEAPQFQEVEGNKTLTTGDLAGRMGVGLFIVPLMGLLESIAIGKAFARQGNYNLDTNQEMIAIGAANIISSFVSSYSITGSFSRTAINAQSNVKTPVGGIFSGILVIISLAILTPSFYFIPKSALASVIICALIYMIDIKTVLLLWKIKKLDLIPLIITFIVCFWEIPYGILAGAGVSLLIMLYPSTFPNITISRTPHSNEAIVVTPQLDIYYPAAEYFTDKIRKYLYSMEYLQLKQIVIDGSTLTHLEYTGIKSLVVFAEEMDKKGITLIFIHLKPDLAESLRRADAAMLIHYEISVEDIVSGD